MHDGAVGSESEVTRGPVTPAPLHHHLYRRTIPTISSPEGLDGRVVPTDAAVVYGQPTVKDAAVGSDSEVTRGPQAPARTTIASPGKPFA